MTALLRALLRGQDETEVRRVWELVRESDLPKESATVALVKLARFVGPIEVAALVGGYRHTSTSASIRNWLTALQLCSELAPTVLIALVSQLVLLCGTPPHARDDTPLARNSTDLCALLDAAASKWIEQASQCGLQLSESDVDLLDRAMVLLEASDRLSYNPREHYGVERTAKAVATDRDLCRRLFLARLRRIESDLRDQSEQQMMFGVGNLWRRSVILSLIARGDTVWFLARALEVSGPAVFVWAWVFEQAAPTPSRFSAGIVLSLPLEKRTRSESPLGQSTVTSRGEAIASSVSSAPCRQGDARATAARGEVESFRIQAKNGGEAADSARNGDECGVATASESASPRGCCAPVTSRWRVWDAWGRRHLQDPRCTRARPHSDRRCRRPAGRLEACACSSGE